ncbi:hypothetical protein LDB30_00770 [Acidithiobacillus ferrooxidans]|nr:hypothetical protein LDB30_00770 [Acidithiobacillus ferrooxidans]
MTQDKDENRNQMIAVLLEGWGKVQDLSISLDESAWRIRGWGFTTWSALVAYSVTSNNRSIALVSIILALSIFFVELGIRQVQYSFIRKSFDIEDCINKVLAGQVTIISKNIISTKIETPDLTSFFEFIAVRRWLTWIPYLLILLTSLFIYVSIL